MSTTSRPIAAGLRDAPFPARQARSIDTPPP